MREVLTKIGEAGALVAYLSGLELITQSLRERQKTMKKTVLLAAMMATAIPLVTVFAEDTTSPTPTEQTKEENPSCMVMNKGKMTGMMGMSNMMSNWKEQDADLDKLVAAMNSASSDKKLDAVAAVVAKLVEQRKAMHAAMQEMMTANGKQMMKMGRMMMQGDQGNQGENEHSQHH